MNAPTQTSSYWIEVAPYEEAAWAPRLAGARFRWAWRVLGRQGDTCLVGACGGPEEKARQLAEVAIERLVSSADGD